ncbi:MAG: hypothetical protein ACJAXQ_000606 [Parvibaculaceae bacterium]|jgi:hypothetical protein|nr:DUF2333 family protein [Parvibaculaceae bacterium]
MSISERFGRLKDNLRHRWMYRSDGRTAQQQSKASGAGAASSKPASPQSSGGKFAWLKIPKFSWAGLRSSARRVGLGTVIFLLAYYLIGGWWINTIDDDADFRPVATDQITGGSTAVSMMAALIDREVNQNSWTANDPFFVPSVWLDNMPNFQQGVMSALARFGFELQDQLGRTRGSSQVDPDLQIVSGLLQYPGDTWYMDLSSSLLPVASAESQYRKARRSLLNYNERLAKGDATFERRGDNLMATLDRIALDLGSSSAVLADQIEDGSYLIDMEADDTFYNVKGQVYAYYLLLTALGKDFEKLIAERELNTAWLQMLDSMRTAALLQPMIIVNSAPDSQLLPSHLSAQGFYLLRARTQLREITNILLK